MEFTSHRVLFFQTLFVYILVILISTSFGSAKHHATSIPLIIAKGIRQAGCLQVAKNSMKEVAWTRYLILPSF